MRLFWVFLVFSALALPASAQTGLRALNTGFDGRGFEAVGRLEIGGRGFCTGALIDFDLVLTAAHCLFDRTSGTRFEPQDIEFLAGWRNGRAEAYRRVRRTAVHPDYDFAAPGALDRVAHDLALLQLEQPIRLPSIRPFAIQAEPRMGDNVGVVSYARGRAEVPSLEERCEVLHRDATGALVMSCAVDFGASGAPVFAMGFGSPQIVSVVSAKAETEGGPVALGASLGHRLDLLRGALASGDPRFLRVGVADGGRAGTGARFLRP